MFRFMDTQEVIDELKDGVYSVEVDRKYVHLTYYQINEYTVRLVIIVGKGGGRTKTLNVVEFNLLEDDNVRDYLPEAQKLKRKLKRYFSRKIVTSDFRF